MVETVDAHRVAPTSPSPGEASGIPPVPDMRPRYLMAKTAAELHAMDTDQLIATLEKRTRRLYQVRAESGERNSWRASIKTVTGVLVEAGLGEVYVLVEMSTLVSNERIDMVLLGSDPHTGDLSLVIVENKQWSQLSVNPRTGLVNHPGGAKQGSLHPLEQAWGYGSILAKQMPMLGENWSCVANLHNASAGELTAIRPPRYSLPATVDPARAKIFGAGPDERRAFADFLTKVICANGAKEHLSRINAAHVRPSDDLMRAVHHAVKRRGGFFKLLEEQQAAFRHIAHVVNQKFSANDKNVFIVVGGPGTGKSVLALELLGYLNGIGSPTLHASGSNAFAKALREHASGTRKEAEGVFTYFNQHRHRSPNQLNVLLCDEAHRLRKDSNSQYMKREERSTVLQAEELINAARVPVFFLDPYQIIRRDEVGTPDYIRQAAIALGIRPENIHQIDLKTQFRQSSCPEYLDWLEDLLGYCDASPRSWDYAGPFQLLVADHPAEMEEYLRFQVALGHSARMTAGYCWKWTKEAAPDGGLVDDIEIGDWRCAWNSSVPREGIPGRDTWATDPRGLDQVGCVYTAQGLEWDYSGVIMGPDFTWTGSKWKAERNRDRTIWGRNLHWTVRNIYRVLATRGKNGTVLYSTDTTTRELLASLGVPPLAPALKELKAGNPGVTAPTRTRAARLVPEQQAFW